MRGKQRNTEQTEDAVGHYFSPGSKKSSSGEACHCLGSGSVTCMRERQACCKRASIAKDQKKGRGEALFEPPKAMPRPKAM
jgi:hypothetical protein